MHGYTAYAEELNTPDVLIEVNLHSNIPHHVCLMSYAPSDSSPEEPLGPSLLKVSLLDATSETELLELV